MIIGGVLTGNLSTYLLPPKPVAREHIPAIPEKWQFTATGAVTGALALGDDGSLYAASEDGFVYAVDSSGSLQWKFNAGPILAGPAIGADGTIYVTNKDEGTYAINRIGMQQWAMESSSHFALPIGVGSALDQDHLYTPWNGHIRALPLNSRAIDWTAGGVETNGSVTILPNGLIVSPGAGRMDAVDSTGRIVWQYPAMNPPLSADLFISNDGQAPLGNFWLDSGIAVGADGTLYACAVDEPGNERRTNSRLVALTSDGRYKWEFHAGTLSVNRATPVIATDGTVYFGSGNAMLYALSSDGKKKWAVNTGADILAMMLAEDGTVYVLNSSALVAVSPDGKLLTRNPIAQLVEPPRAQVIAISTEERKVLTKLPADTSVSPSPTLAADGTVYVGSHGGKIVAFAGTHGGLMNSPWPKFQSDLANSGRSPALHAEWR